MGERLCVVLGDVVASRDIEDRDAVGADLAAGVERANDAVGEHLRAPFAVLKGVDEVGGVLGDLSAAYRAMRTVAEALHPVEIRFGVAWDDVDVAPESDEVARMDGPAFHRADAALRAAADAERYVGIRVAGLPDSPLPGLLAGQCDLLALWKSRWTERQCEVVRAYRESDTMTAVAEDLDVSVNTVSTTLQRARAHTVLAVEGELEDAFARLAREVSA